MSKHDEDILEQRITQVQEKLAGMIDKARKDDELIQGILQLIEKCDWNGEVTLTLVDIVALLTDRGYFIRDLPDDEPTL